MLQITDLHVLRTPGSTLLGVDTAASLEAVLDAAFGERRPDALLVTGDIAHEPSVDTYRRVRRMLVERFDGPTLCLPGNHDVLAPMQEAGLPVAPLALDGWQIYGLDTHEDDTLAARLPADVLAAFEHWLARARGNVLIATHHPFVDVGCPWLDPDRLADAAQLLDRLARHNRSGAAAAGQSSIVRAIVFGHAHQEAATTHEGIGLYVTPSTCFQFAPRTPRFTIDDLAPGCRWLDLHPDGRVSTRVLRADHALEIDLADRGAH